MPPLPVIPGVYRLALLWTTGAQDAVNVIHVGTNLGLLQAQVLADVIAAFNANQASMFASVSLAAALEQVACTPLDGTSGTVVAPCLAVGQAAGQYVPQSAVIVKLQTGLRGRLNRGRIFLPFTAESVQVNGAIPLLVATTIGNGWSLWNGAIDVIPYNIALGVASYKNALFHPVIGNTCEIQTGTQRRRQERNR